MPSNKVMLIFLLLCDLSTLAGCCNYFTFFKFNRIDEIKKRDVKYMDDPDVTPDATDEEAVMLIGGKYKRF